MEEVLKVLLTYGPGGVIAALVVLGVLMPKSVYDREVKRGDTATLAASQNAEALNKVSDALRVATESIGLLRGEVAGLKVEVADLKVQLARRGVLDV